MPLLIDPWSFPDCLTPPTETTGESRIVLGGGCFWCTEAVYRDLDGVVSVTPGYAGDTAEAADYRLVSSGITDHAEVIEVNYDAGRLSLATILKVFFAIAHDPTQIDRQGNDVGRHYRSVIFYETDEQHSLAAAYMAQINAAGLFDAPLATTLHPLTAFYPAEDYHHDYAARNPYQPYVHYVAKPKVERLRNSFANLLKAE